MSDKDRLKRLRMRSWRRGIKEMDLILGHFADDRLGTMSPGELDVYEALLTENDQELYAWVTDREAPPEDLAGLVLRIKEHAEGASAQQSDVP